MNLTLGWCGTNFYPRPPRGGRQAVAWRHPTVKEVLSTPSARRATRIRSAYTLAMMISIHALREEGDVRRSHHSCRSRISIHALREEGDLVQS